MMLARVAVRDVCRSVMQPAFSASTVAVGSPSDHSASFLFKRTMCSAPIVHPPPSAALAATADLCDVHVSDAVDVTVERKVQIAQPVFR